MGSSVLIWFIALLLFTSVASGNVPPSGEGDAAKVFPSYSFLSQRETWAALAVLIFGLLMALFTFIGLRTRLLPTEALIRVIALILIVTGTLFLVTAGYSAEQIAPALGLLGSIAGYLLGRSDTPTARHDGKPDDTL